MPDFLPVGLQNVLRSCQPALREQEREEVRQIIFYRRACSKGAAVIFLTADRKKTRTAEKQKGNIR